jgi:Cys-rich four helix bundle protein (predicted Tat secretion target)
MTERAGETALAIDRRAVLAAGAGFAAALAAGTAHAAGEHDHHMDHGATAPHQAVIDAALACVNRGDVCADHCIALLGKGDTAMADCLHSVSVMLPMCATLAKLAALDAKRLGEFAKVCIDVCADCEAECKKHAEKHAACKACADSCASCIKACKTLA